MRSLLAVGWVNERKPSTLSHFLAPFNSAVLGKLAIVQVKMKGSPLKQGSTHDSSTTPLQQTLFCCSGDEIYASQVRSQVEEGNHGKIVAIDIETGAFEVANDSLTAAKQLLKRYPDAQIFGIRIGHRAVHRFGFTLLLHPHDDWKREC